MSTPGSVTTPLQAGHAYEVTLSKADVQGVDPSSSDDASLAWEVVDGIVSGGVDSDGSKPGAAAVGSDMSDGGDTWVMTLTPRVATSIGGSSDNWTTVGYDVVDVSGNAPSGGGGAPAAGGSLFATIWGAVKAHPVVTVAALAAGLFLVRPHRSNPRVRRMRSALRF
jgi:hypothetical protein